MILIDGKQLSSILREDIKNQLEKYSVEKNQKTYRKPGLTVILVGDNPASKTYVANKEKVATKCGFQTKNIKLPADIKFEDLISEIKKCNQDPSVDGILLQLPLPKHLDSFKCIEQIDPSKDVDGLHPSSQGYLCLGKKDAFRSCTPYGVMALIDYQSLLQEERDPKDIRAQDIKPVSLAGKTAVVLGRSILVGKPMALMLLERDATVTIAHSKTKNLESVCQQADILVAAVGQANLVKASWIKPGAVVIDVGINRLPDGKIVGDVDFDQAKNVASAITPVPGGVGPMTIAILLQNTFMSWKKRQFDE